jgi:hypothetical protein
MDGGHLGTARRRRIAAAALALPALVALAVAVIAPPATSAPTITTVMTKLNSPRGLTFAPTGDLLIAEAGDGGAACTAANTMTLPPRNVPICVNRSGSITVLTAGQTSGSGDADRDQTGWPSWRSDAPNQPFAEVTGPQDISVAVRGRAYVSVGWGGTPASRSNPAARGKAFGRLVKTGPTGGRTTVADIAAYEQSFNPASGPVDSNPYGILAEPSSVFVADAGANALYEMKGKWKVSLVATFPRAQNPAGCRIPAAPGVQGPPAPPTSEFVPTTVVRGLDKALYVGGLTGFPFCAGAASIWKVVPGGAPTVHLTGFKAIIDMAFAKDGTLYVLQYASGPSGLGGPGQIVRVSPGGTRTVLETRTALLNPAGITINPSNGALYVTNKTVTPGGGEVLRIVP